MTTLKGLLVRRILAVWLTLAIGWPNSALALRPMTGQGAGLEELGQKLAGPAVPKAGLRVIADPEHRFFDLAVSPDGSEFVSAGSDGAVHLWDGVTGLTIRVLQVEGPKTELVHVRYSPDGQRVAAVNLTGSVFLWEIATGRLLRSFQPETHPENSSFHIVTQTHFYPEGALRVLVGDGKQVNLWDVESGKLVRTLHVFTTNEISAGKNQWRAADFSPEGRWLATAGEDVRVWDLESGAMVRNLAVEEGGTLLTVQFSPDGSRLAAGGMGKKIQVWNLRSESSPTVTLVHTSMVRSLAFDGAGQTLAWGDSLGGVAVGRLDSGGPPGKLEGHQNWVDAVVFDRRNGFLISAGEDRTLRFWGPSRAQGSAAPSPRLLGFQGGADSVEFLSESLSKLSGPVRLEALSAVLTAAILPDASSPLSGIQWNRWMAALSRMLEEDPPLSVQEAERLERVFVEALSLEGPPLDPSVFESSVDRILFKLWGGSAESLRPIFREMTPKDQLAHAVWAVSLQSRLGFGSGSAAEIARQMLLRETPYQDLVRLYELWRQFPEQTTEAFRRTMEVLAAQSDSGRRFRYWEAFQKWLVWLALMRPALERLNAVPLFLGQLAPDSWHSTAERFQESSVFLEKVVADSAGKILGVTFRSDRPTPWVDGDYFSRRERNRFLLALVYQAEHQGESFRQALAAYFKALQDRPADRLGAALAAQRILLERTPDPPPEVFLTGPSVPSYLVAPEARSIRWPNEAESRWTSLTSELRRFVEEVRAPDPARKTLRDALAQWPPSPPIAAVLRSIRDDVHRGTQDVLETLNGDERESVLKRIQGIRDVLDGWVQQAEAQEAGQKPIFVQIGIEQDPVEALFFSYPSLLCLDCMTGLFRRHTQYYVTHLHHRILIAKDPEHPDQDPPLARLTVGRTEKGELVVTNALVSVNHHRFEPVFIDYLEKYARRVGRPAYLPTSFFPASPGPAWKLDRVNLSFLAGADAQFHFDLGLTGGFPYRSEDRSVWRYDPSAESTGLVSADQLGVLLRTMGQFLGAREETQVERSFLTAAQDVLGYSGVAVYRVQPETGKIKKVIRDMKAQSRSEDWNFPEGEQAEAIRRATQRDEVLHIRSRSQSPFVDPNQLARDRERYPGKDVEEVVYVPLRGVDGDVLALIHLNKWATGERIFQGLEPGSPAEEKAKLELQEWVETLSSGALLALSNLQSVRHLKSFMGLDRRGGQVAGELNRLANLFRELSKSAVRLQGNPVEDMEILSREVQGLASDLESEARGAMQIVRERRARSPGPQRLVQVMPKDKMVGTLADISVGLLASVAVGSKSEVLRVAEEYERQEEFREGSVERAILDDWVQLSFAAIEARDQMDHENRQFMPRLGRLRERASALLRVRRELSRIQTENDLEPGAASVVSELLPLFETVFGDVERLVLDLTQEFSAEGRTQRPEGAGLEERGMTRFFYHPALLPPNYAGVEEIPIPADPAQARRFLLEAKLKPRELVILPESINAGMEEAWRPGLGPTVVINPVLLGEMTPDHLAALAARALLEVGQVLRVGLEEWGPMQVEVSDYVRSQY